MRCQCVWYVLYRWSDHLEAEPHGGVADLLLAKGVDAPLDVLVGDRGGDPLNPHEVLLVKPAQAIAVRLELTDERFDLLGVHDYLPSW